VLQILDSIVRIGNVYLKLSTAGCVLFKTWQAKFLCDPDRTVVAFVKFGEKKQSMTLKSRRQNEADDVSTVIPRLARFMEECHNSWLHYISEKRDRCPSYTYL
jgi:hypothetical protein